ncbi:MAG TPA: FtsW/RodA/SpoVE family cell cycle protein [Tepidisphaeraceae bacterium]|jgi:rod shape determining protein RodA|nr:FtsW/RodA/SpoVE family cell cycle protein [Tepidisphaeraceae bacterium]
MNRLWKQLAIATNWPVLAAVFLLSAVGVVSIWADAPKEAMRQAVFLVVAIVCMALFQAVNYQKIGRFAWPFYCFSLLLILYTVVGSVVHVPGVTKRNGAYNWIAFGSFSLQPAELMKISFVLLLARYLRFRSNYRSITGLLAPFALALVPMALILKQPDLGTALIFIPALFAMLFVAGAKIKHLLAIVGMGLATVPFLWLSGQHVIHDDAGGFDHVCQLCPSLPVLRHFPQFVKHYQRERVNAMFSSDPQTMKAAGFQQRRAEIAFGSGGLSGKGIGNIPIGRQVPEGHNDMIFALIGEQFGFFGAAVVLGAYIVLFTAGVEIASGTREPFGRLIALGVVSILAGQTFLNLMVATKLMPVTGVTLPFISYGGSSLIASFMAAGLLLNVGQNRPLVMAKDAFEFGE